MRAELAGNNSPSLEVPVFQEPETTGGGGAEDEGDFWGDEEVAEDEGDFWGEEDAEDAALGGEFSDAVALQFPSQIPGGIRKPFRRRNAKARM